MKSEQLSHIHHHFYPSNYTTLLLSDSWMIFQRMVGFLGVGVTKVELLQKRRAPKPRKKECIQPAQAYRLFSREWPYCDWSTSKVGSLRSGEQSNNWSCGWWIVRFVQIKQTCPNCVTLVEQPANIPTDQLLVRPCYELLKLSKLHYSGVNKIQEIAGLSLMQTHCVPVSIN